VIIHVQVLNEVILALKWIFVRHYDLRLKHAFDDALVDTKQKTDSQQN